MTVDGGDQPWSFQFAGSNICLFFSHIAGAVQILEARRYLCIGVMVGGRCFIHRYPLLRGVFTI